MLECKGELVATQQASITANRNAVELELGCAKLDEVSEPSPLSSSMRVIRTCHYKERNRCLQTIKAEEAELSALRDNLSQLKAALKTATTKNDDLKKSLDEITFQLKKRVSSGGGAGQ